MNHDKLITARVNVDLLNQAMVLSEVCLSELIRTLLAEFIDRSIHTQ